MCQARALTALVLHFEGRPPTHNRTRSAHFHDARRITKEYRERAALQSLRKPKFARPVTVRVSPHCNNNRLADAGACFDVAKAIIDGIVDAGLLPDDGPKWVRQLIMDAPVNSGEDVLIVCISEVEDD